MRTHQVGQQAMPSCERHQLMPRTVAPGIPVIPQPRQDPESAPDVAAALTEVRAMLAELATIRAAIRDLSQSVALTVNEAAAIRRHGYSEGLRAAQPRKGLTLVRDGGAS